MENLLQQYKEDLENELRTILDFWQKNTIDEENGDFFATFRFFLEFYSTRYLW